MSHRVKPAQHKPHLVVHTPKEKNNNSFYNYNQGVLKAKSFKESKEDNSKSENFLYQSVKNNSLIGSGTDSVFDSFFSQDEAIAFLENKKITTPEDAILYFAEFDDYTIDDVRASIELDAEFECELDDIFKEDSDDDLSFLDEDSFQNINFEDFNGFTEEEVASMLWYIKDNLK